MPFLGRPLIARLVERLRGLSDDLLVITNRPEAYAFLELPLYGDLIPSAGPLGGLYTALHAARRPLVAVLACDMPFVSARLVAAQRDLLVSENADVVIPRSEDGLEPLHAVYRRDACLEAVRAALDAGERKMISWLPRVRARVMMPEEVAAIDLQFRSFINVNAPEEFQRAEALARSEDEYG